MRLFVDIWPEMKQALIAEFGREGAAEHLEYFARVLRTEGQQEQARDRLAKVKIPPGRTAA